MSKTKDKIIAKIRSLGVDQAGFSSSFCNDDDPLTQGCFVLVGYHTVPIEWSLGYVLQIRKGAGAFGSSMVFIRHYSGVIVMHENQCFWIISGDQLEIARKLFIDSGCNPDDEDYSNGYTIKGDDQTNKVGFIINE